jgi:hypothetical protein
MSNAKQASKRKRRSKTLPVLGAAGLSLSLVGSATATTGGPATDNQTPRNILPNHEIILGEEEISDVSLGTFYVFDNENADALRPNIQLARGGGCGCGGRGCGGRGCGGCGGRGCGGCGWGGIGLGLGLGLGLGYGLGYGYGYGCYGYGYGYGCYGYGRGGCCRSWGGCRYC